MKLKKLFFCAGEPSGDQRGAELIREIKKLENIEIHGMGGDAMEAAGMRLFVHIKNYSVMGFGEIVSSLFRFMILEKRIHEFLKEYKPDAVVLVDYPGFNLRLATWAQKQGFYVIYYISPQVWAWRTGRVKKIRKSVDLMITLFKFEADFYERNGVRVYWAGHPLMDSIDNIPSDGRLLALLPGSREQEIKKNLPPMLEACKKMINSHSIPGAVIATSPSVPEVMYKKAKNMGVKLVSGTLEALDLARAAVVCSGTATLETALRCVPFVVVYRTSAITYRMAKFLVRQIDRIALANLVTGEDVAVELIQHEVTADNIEKHVLPFFKNSNTFENAKKKLLQVREALGPPGAAEKAAKALIESLEN